MSANSPQATRASVADFSTFKVAGALEKPCLGQPFQLGMLYDCRSDALIPGVTLWGSEALNTALSKKPFETSDFEIIAEDSLSEKLLRLGVDASLKLSILSGLVQVEGAAKFLYDQKSSKKQARVSLKYKSTTRFEQLTMDQLGNFEYTDVFEKDIATHVVTGMVYGADAFFVFDREIGENEDMKKIHGNLKVKVGGLPGLEKLAIGGEGSVDVNTGDKEDEERLHCKFYGDLILPKHPATFHDAAKVYQELPELLQGKSVPKKVWLYPLGKLDSKAQRMVHQISSRLVDELHMLMESLHDIIMRGNDLIKTEVCSNFFGLKDDLENMKGLISGYRADLEKNLATLLPKVRGGGTDETNVAEILKKNSLSPFSRQTLSGWISGKENEVKILAGYLKHLKQQEVIQLAFEPGAVDVIINDLEIEAVVCFDFGITWGQDALLLKMEDYLHNGEARQGGSTSQPWYRNQALMREMRQQFRCFKSFAIPNHRREATRFVVTNSDSKNDTETAFVSLYESGCESKFEAPDKPGRPQASNISCTGLQLSWEIPKYSANVHSYTVSYTDDESSDQWCTQTTSGAEQQLMLSKLVPGTAYCFKVRAETNAGSSPDSDVCKTKLPPDAPGKPHASSITHNSLQLNWNKPSHGSETVQSYTIFYRMSDSNDWNNYKLANQQEYVNLSNLAPKTAYVFKVRAESAAGPSPDSEFSDPIETLLPISEPGKPTATRVTHNSVALQWDKPKQSADIVKCYTIFYRRSVDDPGVDSSWHTHKTSDPLATAQLTDLVPQTAYVFKVRAESAADASQDSEISDPIETLLPISQPGKPRNSKVTHNSITLKWDKPERGADKLEQYTIFYKHSVDDPDAGSSWCTHKTSNPLETVQLSDLVPQTAYIFKVRAESTAGASQDSEISDPIETLSPISQPGKPKDFKVTHNSIILKWDKPKRGADKVRHYTIFYRCSANNPSVDSSWRAHKTSDPLETAELSDLVPQTAYVFKVRAESTAGASQDSEISDPIETLLPISQPGKPRNSKVTHNSITLEWDKPKRGADIVKHYTIFCRRSVDTDVWNSFKTPNQNVTATVVNLDPKMFYIFKVKAESTTVSSPESESSDPIETLSPISQPGKPYASNVTHNSITLQWSKSDQGAEIVQYYTIFYRRYADDTGKWTAFRTFNVQRNAVLPNLDPKTAYVFKLRAESATLGSSPDGELSDPIETLLPISQPGKPIATDVTHDCITLRWLKPEHGSHDVQRYIILRRDTHSGINDQIAINASRARDNPEEVAKLHNFAPNTEYTFKVRAESNTGVSPDSELSDPVRTLVPISEPGKPFATKVTHDSVTLKWERPKQGAQYLKHYKVIYYSTDDSENTTSCTAKAEKSTLSKLDPQNAYIFKVQAETVAGSISESEISDPIETLLSPPGKPYASDITYKGFRVNWQRPSYRPVLHYYVSYQTRSDPPDKWHTKKTVGDITHLSFSAAKGNLYVFKVAAVTSAGVSSDSELSDPIETKAEPWGAKIYKSLDPIPHSNPPTYLLPTHCVMKKKDIVKVHVGANSHGKIKSGVHMGCLCHTRTPPGVRHKVLMVVGATGAGKTTLINGIANYIMNVQWDDEFRFKLIAESTSQDQSKSQTMCITAYTFYKESGSNLPYTLTVIDTPGFGDTGGLTRDKYIVSQIKELFSIAGAEGIDELHGIGFVTQAPLARLTPTQRYVFDAILSVFGKDVADNIFLMITFADGMKPPVLDAVKAANVPNKAFFKFNNSALFASKSADDEFDKMFWKMGTKSFDEFFQRFSNAQPQSLQLSREVIQERETLEVTIQGLQPQIQLGLSKIDELRQDMQMLKSHEADILTNQDFTYTVEVTKQRKIDLPIGKYTTNCLTCNYTCHDDCVYNDDDDKYKCSAMRSGRGTPNAACGICPQKCSWRLHKNNPYRFELYKENETRTSDKLRKKYESAMSSKEQLECVIEDMKKELDTMNMAVLRKMEQARRSVQRLQEIALKPNYLTEVEYIDLIIETEKREAKPRWLERVKALEGVRQQAEIVTELMKNPPAQGQQQYVFSIEETVQEKSMWQKFLHKFSW